MREMETSRPEIEYKKQKGPTFHVCCQAAVELADTCCGGHLSDQ